MTSAERSKKFRHKARMATRRERVERVAKVIFRYRDPSLAGKFPGDFTLEDGAEAERFIDMLDASQGRYMPVNDEEEG
jgi:hypothetical protein